MTFFPALVALTLGLVLQPLAIRGSRRFGVIDRPNDRSSHTTPTPRGGGVAVVLGLLVGLCLIGGRASVWALALATLIAGGLGVAEDVRGVRVGLRIAVQSVAACVIVVAAIADLGSLWILAPLGVFFVVGLINAVNFMDGVNGITGAVGLVAGLIYAVLLTCIDQSALASSALVVTAVSLGFLPFNIPRARIFLGDSGSYGLGAAIAGLSVYSFAAGATLEAAVAPVALYVADTGAVVLRRLRRGDPIHVAHRSHVYQRLTDCGWSHVQVAGVVAVFTLAIGSLGLLTLSGGWVRVGADVTVLGLLATYLLLPRVVASRKHGSGQTTPDTDSGR